jgi:hypothetical protein
MPIPSTRSSTSKRTYAPRETASRQYGVHLNDDTARRKREGTERFTARREGEVAAVAPPPAPRQTVNPALAVEAKGAQIRPTTTQPVPAHPQLCILRTPLTSGTTTRVSAQHRLSDHTEYRIHNWRKLPSGRVVRGDGAGPVVALWALALGWMYMAYQRRGAVLRVVSGWMVRAGLMKVQCGPEVGEETVSVLGYDVGAVSRRDAHYLCGFHEGPASLVGSGRTCSTAIGPAADGYEDGTITPPRRCTINLAIPDHVACVIP